MRYDLDCRKKRALLKRALEQGFGYVAKEEEQGWGYGAKEEEQGWGYGMEKR